MLDVAKPIAETFDGVIAGAERLPIASWPTPEQLDALLPGELWVSKDLAAYIHPRNEWIIAHGKPARPMVSNDLTSVDDIGGEWRLRVYRCMDRQWYSWLHNATSKAKTKLAQTSPAAWEAIAIRFNELWRIAKRWWPGQTAQLHQPWFNDARYEPPEPSPAIAARWRVAPRTPMSAAGTRSSNSAGSSIEDKAGGAFRRASTENA